MALTLRPALTGDIPLLERWNAEPHVISSTTDVPNASEAFAGINWAHEIAMQSDVFQYYIAELDHRPIGAMQMIDPHLEPEHYWGEIEPNLRALDIWIGEADCLGRGYGTQMMRIALDMCFAEPTVTAIIIDPLASNERAHRFYQRLGFKPVERRILSENDECLVHRLTRADWITANSN